MDQILLIRAEVVQTTEAYAMRNKQYLIIDLEATCCTRNEFPRSDMEIIEIGCVIVDETYTILGTFARFVKPALNPQLTEYCRNLTNISQDDIDRAPALPNVLIELRQWMSLFDISEWGSWGMFDRKQINAECARSNCTNPLHNIKHVNLKCGRKGLNTVLAAHGLQFQGVPHRALTDAKNVAYLYHAIYA